MCEHNCCCAPSELTISALFDFVQGCLIQTQYDRHDRLLISISGNVNILRLLYTLHYPDTIHTLLLIKTDWDHLYSSISSKAVPNFSSSRTLVDTLLHCRLIDDFQCLMGGIGTCVSLILKRKTLRSKFDDTAGHTIMFAEVAIVCSLTISKARIFQRVQPYKGCHPDQASTIMETYNDTRRGRNCVWI